MRILGTLLLLLPTPLAATPTVAAVPYCPVDDVTLCTEHGRDGVRRTWLDANAEGAHVCLILQTDLTWFLRHGAFTCGIAAETPAGETEACLDHRDYVYFGLTDACVEHEGVTGTTSVCYQGELERLLRASHEHEGCLAHEDATTGSTHACWDRWDAVFLGIVLSWGSACFEHSDPVTGRTRVDDHSLRFTNVLVVAHEGGTNVSASGGAADARLDGFAAFGAFHDWSTSGNVTTLASWEGAFVSDPLSQRLFVAACLRASSASVCLP